MASWYNSISKGELATSISYTSVVSIVHQLYQATPTQVSKLWCTPCHCSSKFGDSQDYKDSENTLSR